MKKLIIAFAAVAFFASCKKDYVCECVVTVAGVSGTPSTIDLGKQKKSDAEDLCKAKDASTTTLGITATTTCTAKEK
jgi:hypothetical protein